MKKSIFIIGISIILLSSCTKYYECECTQNTLGQTSIINNSIPAKNKRDAKDACENISISSSMSTTTCELK